MDVGGEKGGLSREEIAGEAGEGGKSPALPRIVPNKNRRVQVAPTSRRLFDKAARKVFLEWFAGTGNLSLSARKAGFHYRTVLRHRVEDAVFRGEFDLALEQSEVRVQAWLMEAKDAGLDAEGSGFDPGGADEEGGGAALDGHAPANLTTEQAMQLLKANAQRKALRQAQGGPHGAGRVGRAPAAASNEEVLEALVKGIRALGVRLKAEDARRLAAEEMGHSHQSSTLMGTRGKAAKEISAASSTPLVAPGGTPSKYYFDGNPEAGAHAESEPRTESAWIPAFAGMTEGGGGAGASLPNGEAER